MDAQDLSLARKFLGGFARLGTTIIDLVFPPRCPLCGRFVLAGGELCRQCADDLPLVRDDFCPRCLHIHRTSLRDIHRCFDCVTDPPPFVWVRSPFLYEGAVRTAIIGMKFSHRRESIPFLGREVARTIERYLDPPYDDVVVIPVPLSPSHLLTRGFDQSFELVRVCSIHLPALSYVYDAIEKIRETEPQSSLNRREREKNVRGAYRVRKPDSVKNARVVVVDDIVTTGFTVREIARILKRAGAHEVAVVCAARAK